MVNGRPSEKSQRTGPPSNTDLFPSLRKSQVGSSDIRTLDLWAWSLCRYTMVAQRAASRKKLASNSVYNHKAGCLSEHDLPRFKAWIRIRSSAKCRHPEDVFPRTVYPMIIFPRIVYYRTMHSIENEAENLVSYTVINVTLI